MEYILLGLIREGADHGYEIYRSLRQPQGLGLVWRVKQSQLYALLDKLEHDELLESRVANQENRPARKVYRLTQPGEAAWAAWVGEPVAHPREVRQQLLAKLYFIHAPEAAVCLLEKQREIASGWLRSLQQEGQVTRTCDGYDRLVWGYRLHEVEGLLGWLDQEIDRLRKPSGDFEGEPG